MTDTEINIAIAEACGWKWYRIPRSEKHSRGPIKSLFLPAVHEADQDPIWLHPGEPNDRIANWEYMKADGHVSNYCNDLNAMHEAEQTLKPDTREDYAERLSLVCFATFEPDIGDWFGYAGATARQRAEAFLRTLGKWKD